METKKLYGKIVDFPQKLFGEKLYKVLLESGNIQDITHIPTGETHIYTLKIIVDIPYKDIEKYADRVKNYYKKKTENTAFKIEAELVTRLHFKMRSCNGIIPLDTAVLYDSEPPRQRLFVSSNYPPVGKIKTNGN